MLIADARWDMLVALLAPWFAPAASGVGLLLGLVAMTRGARESLGRQQMPEQPPPIWQRVRWVILMFEAPVAACLPTTWRVRLQARLREAGLELALTPERFVSGQVLCALTLGLGTWAALQLIGAGAWPVSLAVLLGFYLPAARLRDAIAARRRSLVRDLPTMLDLVVLSVQGGAGLSQALALAVDRGPAGPMREELSRVLREVRAGRPRQEALRSMADRHPEPGLRHAVGALVMAERHGADLSLILTAQADQRRQERFLEAERIAMQAPVKLLLPLVVFIFPGTFLILMYPVAMQLLAEGFLG
ncbi:MAG: type II secretion system F family protein [Burkholderiaceae bacterium]